MKRNTTYTLVAWAAGALLALSACNDDDDFTLDSYPVNHPSLSIADTEDNAQTLELNAVYQADGTLLLDGPVSRTYNFSFLPSPEDAKVWFEVVSSNIPLDSIQIDQRTVTIPAGYSDASVTVSLKNENFSFAQSTDEEATYELGVRATVDGYNMGESQVESKVLIKKEAYSAVAAVEGPNANTATFDRAYVVGQGVVNTDTMTYKFKVVLNRVARKDVTVRLSTAGLPEQFAGDVMQEPEVITIPAGKRESEEIAWMLKDDFLEQTDESESHTLTVTASIESEDAAVKLDETQSSMTIQVNKILRNFKTIEAADPTWTELEKKRDGDGAWTVETDGRGTASRLIDGKGGYSASSVYKSDQLTITVDMAAEKTLNGMAIDYTGQMSWDFVTFRSINAAKKATISTSSDGVTWENQGMLDMPKAVSHYISFFSPVKTRYVKIELEGQYNESSYAYIEVTEIYLYGTE